MAKFRFLDVVRPFAAILPEVASPPRPVPFNMKIMFTSLSLLLFLVLSQLPPVGSLAHGTGAFDPLVSARGALGATPGTLGALGVLPLLSAGFALQVAASARLVDVNFGLKEDRALFGTAQKLVALVLSAIQASLLILTGHFGTPPILTSFSIVVQLVLSTLTIALLDELIQKGHGLGAGTLLFAGAHACTTAIWGAASLRTLDTPRGAQREGALPALVQLFFGWNSYSRALTEAFHREHAPNILGLATTLALLAAGAAAGRVRAEFAVKHVRVSAQRGAYPIRLLYTGAMPLLALSALRANFLLITSALAAVLPPSLPVRLLVGAWNKNGVPRVGLASALAPPADIFEALWHPLGTVSYAALCIIGTALASHAWLAASGSEAYHVAKQLQEQQLTMVGHREGQMSKELKKAIPAAALLGGALLGALTFAGDVAGAFGGGAAVLVGGAAVQTFMAMGMVESGYGGEMPPGMVMPDSF